MEKKYKLAMYGKVVAVDKEHVFIDLPESNVIKYDKDCLPIPIGGFDSLLNKKIDIQVILWVDL